MSNEPELSEMRSGKVKKADTKVPRNVLSLGLVSFFTDVSSEMVFSILPTFILGLPGSTRAVLGLIEGVAEALSYGMRAVSGVFSDRFRRRKAMVFIGYGFSNVVKPLFSVAHTAIDALLIRVSDRIGKGVRTSPRDALLSESVSPERMGVAFGLHRTLDQLGAILGPLLASTIIIIGLTARDVFWLSFLPGLVALLVLLVFVEERIGKTVGEMKLLTGMKFVLRGRFSLLLVIVGLFSLGAFNFSFILLRAKETGVPEGFIPLVYAVINVAHTAIAMPAGLLSDRIGREKVLIIGYGVFLASTLLLSAPVESPAYGFLIAVVYGVYVGIVETVQRALVPGYTTSELRGTAYGLYYLTVGSAFFVANIVTGTLWEYVGLEAAIVYSAVTSAVAIASMTIFFRRSKDEP